MNAHATSRLTDDAAGVAEAARLLRAGQLVAFPTETVYGLGADARQGQAVAAIYAAKGRPSFNPLIVHVADLDSVRDLVDLDPNAEKLAATFWPGALTLVAPLRAKAGVSELVTAGLPSLAVRVPDHPLAQRLLQAFGGPVAAPSANPSGRVSPTEADHVLSGLDGRIAAVLDGGACGVGLESTIVATQPAPRLLRAGGIPAEAVEACLGAPLVNDTTPEVGDIAAPGQLASHYAPLGHLRRDAMRAERGEVFVGFGPVEGDVTLSATGDLTEAAARLFGVLHDLDRRGVERIAVAPIPDHGLGRAINDRLRRAAAPR